MTPNDSSMVKERRRNVGPQDPNSHNESRSQSHRYKVSLEPQATSLASIATAATHAALPSWTTIVLMISLIFGGCCANVFALEAIIKDHPSSGPLITFVQFIITALFTAPSFLSMSAGPSALFLAKRVIPLRSWLIYTGFFVTVNLLNNWAFAYKISVPLHIILRSGGPVASMVIGHLYNGKSYSKGQVSAVAMLTVGVIAAALADARAKGQSIDIGYTGSDSSITDAIIGFTILALAMVLSAFQGIYADRLYEAYGRSHWKEALFYSHILSLPLFIPSYPHLSTHLESLYASPSLLAELKRFTTKCGRAMGATQSFGNGGSLATSVSLTNSNVNWAIDATSSVFEDLKNSKALHTTLDSVPAHVFYLMMNALTQYLCIRGVHILSAKSSSLTVTIVLNIRKLVSLLISIRLFGNNLAPGVLLGALFVFVGGALYGFEGTRLRKVSVKTD